MFYARGVALPERVVDRIPARPTQEMRPGAVMFDATRQRLAIHIRRSVGGCHVQHPWQLERLARGVWDREFWGILCIIFICIKVLMHFVHENVFQNTHDKAEGC